MDIIHKFLIKKGFEIHNNENHSKGTNFIYSFTIDGFAEYNIIITSYGNWVFKFETEKISLSNVVAGFVNHTCFLGVISSENSIEILEIIFDATGINTLLNYLNNENETH
jgi:hypothetical protein